ncbi:MAG: ParB N-terminal domain-containing protein [Acidobacteriota bacterium]
MTNENTSLLRALTRGGSDDPTEIEDQRGTRLEVAAIKPRVHGDTRALDATHVENLARSIEALGLLEPLVVDRHGHLIAGAHRLAAIKLLADRQKWGASVPVRVLQAVDSSEDAKAALLAEIAENEHRRDYTGREVQEVARRLEKAGFKQLRGRPRKGDLALMPALQAVVGKSQRRLRQILLHERDGKRRKDFRLLMERVRRTIGACLETEAPREFREIVKRLRAVSEMIDHVQALRRKELRKCARRGSGEGSRG